jgi:uncharacterized protein YyaL (SSP411 family)
MRARVRQWPGKGKAAIRACRRAVVSRQKSNIDLIDSLKAAYAWLCAAQDANGDGGVAGWYNLARGWGGSYPETTGYIIPTLLHYGTAMDQPDAAQRAIRMANWEIEVQLPTGAVRSGAMGSKVGPAVFNTGQVLFGWVAAYEATGDERFAQAASKAARWLVESQDPDGAWRRDLSVLTSSGVQAYNARAAWGVAVAGDALEQRCWIDAALGNCDWTIAQQQSNGWFAHNTFSEGEDPLLHTIAYVLEGLLGVGQLLENEKCIHAVVRGVSPLVDIYRRTGKLKGRYDRNWTATVSWRCLTGEAQTALVLERLATITGNSGYREMSRALLQGVAAVQDTESPHSETYGAISGSEPLWGGYGPFNYFNWAAKFYIDALLLHLFGVDARDASRAPMHLQVEPTVAS